ncbi:MAG: hypothetical protein O2819_06135 [Planctomycetota bacterium]|nr:hypothetical protein [Planctomycetota bacterium]MDA1106750.1 hypothetical protein [Planctomycetota bacterium]
MERRLAVLVAFFVFLAPMAQVALAACPPDLDGDGQVGGGDLASLLASWGSPAGDITGDGATDGADLTSLLSQWGSMCPGKDIIPYELAGTTLLAAPWFTPVDVVLQSQMAMAAVDANRLQGLSGGSYPLYVVADRNGDDWQANTDLHDLRGTPQLWAVNPGGRAANMVEVLNTGLLDIAGGGNLFMGLGVDLVLDVDGSGTLTPGDVIDGMDRAGMVVSRNPVLAGPFAASTLSTYTASGATSGFTTSRLWYPTAIQSMAPQPLIVISHGNGHQYSWYDFLGTHLASWGYIVISHQNNTVPGIETASTTTLQHTNAIIGQMNTVAAGAIANRIDTSRIGWIGHSRGGEGVARAYDRLVDGTYTPTNYGAEDIGVVISIAPTDFLGSASANPHGVPYMLLYGAADGDVCGCPDNDIADSFNLYERATGWRCSTYIHGADHNDFNCCGFEDFAGPSGTAIGRTEAQEVQKAQMLAALQSRLRGDVGADEFLWRQDQSLKIPQFAATTTIVREFDPNGAQDQVVENFQTNTAVTQSSSGGAVSVVNTYLGEGLLQDANTAFTWVSSDAFNGAVRGRTSDTERSGVFSWADDSTIHWELLPALADQSDQSDQTHLSVRLAQGPRHTYTVTLAGPCNAAFRLVDANGQSATLSINAYGQGVQRPYLRTGYGTGAGWQSEMETFRLPLSDFAEQNAALDLSALVAVELLTGPSHGANVGRLQIDDLLFTRP